MASKQDMSHLEIPDAPVGRPNEITTHFEMMFDLMALAYQADLTRIMTFSMDREASMRTYSNLGISEAFHPLSHHANNPQKLARLAQLQAWHTAEFAKFLQKLKSLPDGEGNMLDNSVIMFGSNMSDSNLHNHFPLPTAIVGGGAGKLKGNRHLRYPDRTPIANVHLTLLDHVGVPIETLGDSTMKFAEI